MKQIKCPNCGGNDFEENEAMRKCMYCGSKFEKVRKLKPIGEEQYLFDIGLTVRLPETHLIFYPR